MYPPLLTQTENTNADAGQTMHTPLTTHIITMLTKDENKGLYYRVTN
jgi:hypothetical protein